MNKHLHQLKARVQRAAALIYWRAHSLRIRHRMNEIDHEIEHLQQTGTLVTLRIMLELQRKQEGKLLQDQAQARIAALGGQAPIDTPHRRHYEQPN